MLLTRGHQMRPMQLLLLPEVVSVGLLPIHQVFLQLQILHLQQDYYNLTQVHLDLRVIPDHNKTSPYTNYK